MFAFHPLPSLRQLTVCISASPTAVSRHGDPLRSFEADATLNRMSKFLIVLAGIAVWHCAAINGIGLYTGTTAKTWWLAPREVLLSKPHLLGVTAAVLAALAFPISDKLGAVEIGAFAAAPLLVLDVVLIGRALKRFG